MTNRNRGLVLFVLLVSAPLLRAQTPAQKRAQAIATELDVDSQELVTLEKETARAMALNNSSFFRRVYSDDYIGAAATGEIRDKNALVNYIQTSGVHYQNFIATDIKVRIYGPSAVVTCTWTARGVQEGHNFSRQYRVTHVYINNEVSGWKVVAGQETLIPG